MKRVLAVLAGASFVMVIGCNDYDLRLEKTLEEKKYEKRLNTNLEAAPAKSKLQADDIFIRPPLGLTGPRDAFSLIAVEPGRFDIENSFLDEKKGTSLHVLARVKKPKPTSPKKGPGTGAAAPEPAARGKFLDDVVEVVKAAYSIELAPGDLKPEQHKHLQRANEYKGKKLELANKQIEVYVFTEPSGGPHEVAMIFEYPTTEKNYMDPKIGLCLESLAVGERAKRFFEGRSGMDVDGGGEMVSPGGAPPI